jgi:hypothetical protein
MLEDFRGHHVVLLSVASSTCITIKTHVITVLVPALKSRSFDARPSFFADLSTHVRAARAIVFRLIPCTGQNGG